MEAQKELVRVLKGLWPGVSLWALAQRYPKWAFVCQLHENRSQGTGNQGKPSDGYRW